MVASIARLIQVQDINFKFANYSIAWAELDPFHSTSLWPKRTASKRGVAIQIRMDVLVGELAN